MQNKTYTLTIENRKKKIVINSNGETHMRGRRKEGTIMERGIVLRENRRNRGMMGNIGFILVTAFLVLFTAFCIIGTVFSRSNLSERELENYYREKEQEMVGRVRTFLNDAGFANSGVTLTRVVEADESREYTLTVHHSRIDRMDEEGKNNLKEKLSAFDFPAENCTFYHEFLITD